MIDIRKILVNPDLLTLAALDKDMKMKTVHNAKQDYYKYCKYCKAIRLLQTFLRNGRGTANADDPEQKISYHCIHVHIQNEIFDEPDIKDWSEITELFDSMMVQGDADCNVTFILMMENIYTGETEDD